VTRAGHPLSLPASPTRRSSDLRPRPSAKVRAEEIADLTGVSLAEIEEIAQAGLIVADARGRYPGRAVDIVQHAAALSRQGISPRSEEHTSELQSRENLVCRLLL